MDALYSSTTATPVTPHRLSGVWLPLVTPFRNGAVDVVSLRRLVRHYAAQPVDGLVLGGTTGEGMTLEQSEIERLAALAAAELTAAGRRLPILLGLSGAGTRRGVALLR
ncbi:MAG TPA: dihydrodipicolinate synthase family protein, partial [Azospirillaceae bacterium]|nr:dihydrodipicolinate synthase family protein [Azospirillaceae bacterium]